MEGRNKREKDNSMIGVTPENDGKNVATNEVDRISLLPEPVLHKIMYLLPTRYAARTSVLSKKWNSFWSTFPVINVSEVNFLNIMSSTSTSRSEALLECRDKCISYLQQTLSRRYMENLDKLKIHTLSHGDIKFYQVIDGLMDEAMKGKLKELDLKFAGKIHDVGEEKGCEGCYRLPEVMFSCGQSLLSLRVNGCNFLDFEENLAVNFHLLKTLSIENTHIDGAFLEKLFRGCPAIESLSVRRCHGLKSIRIFHSKMRHFVLESCGQLEEFKIDAVSLQSFRYKGYYYVVNDNGLVDRSGFNASNDAFKFSSLNKLTLACVRMNAKTFHHMISSFSNLKLVKFKDCVVSERVQVSANSLTDLVIKDCRFDEKLDIRAFDLHAVTLINTFKSFHVNTNGFKYLSSLSVNRNYDLTGSDLQMVVVSCPSLTSLVLTSCYKLDHIKILSERLEYLVISDCVNAKEVRILAHKLKFLKYDGRVLRFSRLFTSNKLVAELHVNQRHFNPQNDLQQFHITEFLQLFSRCVVSITLVCYFAESMMSLKNEHEPPPLDYLSYFKVKTSLGGMDLIDLLHNVLRLSICRKTLCLDIEGSSTIDMEFQSLERKQMLDLNNSLATHNCIMDHLIEVRMTDFRGNLAEMRLVKFLLGNAAHLRKLLINIKENTNLATETRYRSEVLARLNNLPRVSPDAVIVISSNTGQGSIKLVNVL